MKRVIIAYDNRLGQSWCFDTEASYKEWVRETAKVEGASMAEVEDSLEVSTVDVLDLESVSKYRR